MLFTLFVFGLPTRSFEDECASTELKRRQLLANVSNLIRTAQESDALESHRQWVRNKDAENSGNTLARSSMPIEFVKMGTLENLRNQLEGLEGSCSIIDVNNIETQMYSFIRDQADNTLENQSSADPDQPDEDSDTSVFEMDPDDVVQN